MHYFKIIQDFVEPQEKNLQANQQFVKLAQPLPAKSVK